MGGSQGTNPYQSSSHPYMNSVMLKSAQSNMSGSQGGQSLASSMSIKDDARDLLEKYSDILLETL